jgi:hypothetical protein
VWPLSAGTNFYSTLKDGGYGKVKRWTKKLKKGPSGAVRGLCANIFDLDLLVVPINLMNSHWCCGAINFKQKRFVALRLPFAFFCPFFAFCLPFCLPFVEVSSLFCSYFFPYVWFHAFSCCWC